MCIKKTELESKVEEYRNLKTLVEEAENNLKAVEREIIEYMTENSLQEEFSNTSKITYKEQSRTSLDKAKLTEVLGDGLKKYEKVTSYKVLRIK